MAEKTANLSPSADAKAVEIVDSNMNGKPEPDPKASTPNITEHPTSNAADTMNSLVKQVSQLTDQLTMLKAHLRELETRVDRLENQRDEALCSG